MLLATAATRLPGAPRTLGTYAANTRAPATIWKRESNAVDILVRRSCERCRAVCLLTQQVARRREQVKPAQDDRSRSQAHVAAASNSKELRGWLREEYLRAAAP